MLDWNVGPLLGVHVRFGMQQVSLYKIFEVVGLSWREMKYFFCQILGIPSIRKPASRDNFSFCRTV